MATNAILAAVLALGFMGCDSAQQCPPPDGRRIQYSEDAPPEHRVQLTTRANRDGRLLWGGRVVTMPQLRIYLRRSRNFNPLPYLVLIYEEGIDCTVLTDLRRAFDEDGGCSGETFCSEHQAAAGTS